MPEVILINLLGAYLIQATVNFMILLFGLMKHDFNHFVKVVKGSFTTELTWQRQIVALNFWVHE